MKVFLLLVLCLSLFHSHEGVANTRLCMENICIGDDVEQLSVDWKKIKIDYKAKRAVKGLLLGKTQDELYYDFNELLIADEKVKQWLIPYIFHLQKFDSEVLKQLQSVKAICTPLSLTGEIERNATSKLFVTFRAVADDGERGRLRVVQLEKEFNIFPPHIRPSDKSKYVSMVETLKQDYPKMVLVRDIDARATSNEVAFADAILGYRFFSDVNNPLIFRIRDLADLESIEFDEKRSKQCPPVE